MNKFNSDIEFNNSLKRSYESTRTGDEPKYSNFKVKSMANMNIERLQQSLPPVSKNIFDKAKTIASFDRSDVVVGQDPKYIEESTDMKYNPPRDSYRSSQNDYLAVGYMGFGSRDYSNTDIDSELKLNKITNKNHYRSMGESQKHFMTDKYKPLMSTFVDGLSLYKRNNNISRNME